MKFLKIHNFYHRSLLFTFFSLSGAAFNYLLYPAISRVLDVRYFGDFTALNALANQVLYVFVAFSIVSVFIVKKYPEDATLKIQTVQKALVWLFLLLSLIGILFSSAIQGVLNIADFTSFFILLAILVFTVPYTIWNGFLQGHQKIHIVGAAGLVAAFTKLIVSYVLAAAFGVAGGMSGVLIGTIAGLVFLILFSGIKLPSLRITFTRFSQKERRFVRSLLKYLSKTVVVVGGLGFLQNIDILYAKIFFEPDVAGSYAGISIVSNAVFYVGFLLIWILLPEINPGSENHNKRLLKNAYKILALISTSVFFTVLLLEKQLVAILFGNGILRLNGVLTLSTLYQAILVAVILFFYYLLIINARGTLLAALTILAITAITPVIFHDTPLNMIAALCISLVISSIISFVMMLFRKTDHE